MKILPWQTLAPTGSTANLETNPTAINVELYSDIPCDDLSTTEYKTNKRHE